MIRVGDRHPRLGRAAQTPLTATLAGKHAQSAYEVEVDTLLE
jgi:hypothetical protein